MQSLATYHSPNSVGDAVAIGNRRGSCQTRHLLEVYRFPGAIYHTNCREQEYTGRAITSQLPTVIYNVHGSSCHGGVMSPNKESVTN